MLKQKDNHTYHLNNIVSMESIEEYIKLLFFALLLGAISQNMYLMQQFLITI